MEMGGAIELSRWVEKYTDDLYEWACYKVSDPELAKDLVQDTFLAASEKVKEFKGGSTPKTWLFSILNHKIIDSYRKKIKHPVRIESRGTSAFFDKGGHWESLKEPRSWGDEEENLLDNDEFGDILNRCLGELPEQWNLCVKLKYLLGKKGKEICQELEIAPTNFWQMVHRAKLQLRDCIEKKWFRK